MITGCYGSWGFINSGRSCSWAPRAHTIDITKVFFPDQKSWHNINLLIHEGLLPRQLQIPSAAPWPRSIELERFFGAILRSFRIDLYHVSNRHNFCQGLLRNVSTRH